MPKDYKHYKGIFDRMNKTAPVLFAIVSLLSLSLCTPAAFAHEETIVGDIKIVGGWVNEPPLVNEFNGIELTITRNSTDEPITNAVAQLDITLKKGTLTKSLDFQPSEEPGVYVADLLPTQVGLYEVVFQGSVAGQAINSQVEIEDVDDTRTLEFPPRQGENDPVSDEIIEQLQQVIADLNSQVDQATSASEQAVESANEATDAAAELKLSADRAYLFGMVGVGVGVAGIVIGVMAFSRGREKVLE
jgi:hypothetical protein